MLKDFQFFFLAEGFAPPHPHRGCTSWIPHAFGFRTLVGTGTRSMAFKKLPVSLFFLHKSKNKKKYETAPKRHGAELSSAESGAPSRRRRNAAQCPSPNNHNSNRMVSIKLFNLNNIENIFFIAATPNVSSKIISVTPACKSFMFL